MIRQAKIAANAVAITFEMIWNSYFSMEQIMDWIQEGVVAKKERNKRLIEGRIIMVHNGDKVKDRVTGFTGIVIGMTTWLNGCIRAGVQSQAFKDGLPIDPFWVDVGQLEVLELRVLEPGIRMEPLETPGGPMLTPKRTPDPKM